MFASSGVRIILFTMLSLQTDLNAGGKKEKMICRQEVDAMMADKLFPECNVCALCQDYLSTKFDDVHGKINRNSLKSLLQQVNSWHKKGHRSVDPATCSPQRNEGRLIEFEQRELRRSGDKVSN